MKKSLQPGIPKDSRALIHNTLIGLLFGAALAQQAVAAGENDRYQYNALFNPAEAQLRAEDRGRVMIYDGLDNEVVERALDEQFERIEHMMFVRTRQTKSDEEGGEEDNGDDDGC